MQSPLWNPRCLIPAVQLSCSIAAVQYQLFNPSCWSQLFNPSSSIQHFNPSCSILAVKSQLFNPSCSIQLFNPNCSISAVQPQRSIPAVQSQMLNPDFQSHLFNFSSCLIPAVQSQLFICSISVVKSQPLILSYLKVLNFVPAWNESYYLCMTKILAGLKKKYIYIGYFSFHIIPFRINNILFHFEAKQEKLIIFSLFPFAHVRFRFASFRIEAKWGDTLEFSNLL